MKTLRAEEDWLIYAIEGENYRAGAWRVRISAIEGIGRSIDSFSGTEKVYVNTANHHYTAIGISYDQLCAVLGAYETQRALETTMLAPP